MPGSRIPPPFQAIPPEGRRAGPEGTEHQLFVVCAGYLSSPSPKPPRLQQVNRTPEGPLGHREGLGQSRRADVLKPALVGSRSGPRLPDTANANSQHT
jgi:hypothetical protein